MDFPKRAMYCFLLMLGHLSLGNMYSLLLGLCIGDGHKIEDWSKEDESLVSWSNWSEKIKLGMFG